MADVTAYRAACRRIATGLRTAPQDSAFKRDPAYAAVVGNDTRGRAVTEAFLYDACTRHADAAIAARVSTNDRVGAPVRHRLRGRLWSAGSLRYLQVADEIGEAPAVIEIGGGYGGQRLLCAAIADYTIVDVPEALDVARAYLAVHGQSANFVSPDAAAAVAVPVGAVLVSDYALSELEPAVIDRYIAALVVRCARGRITGRTAAVAAVAERLRAHFETVTLTPETPATSRHDNAVVRFADPRGARVGLQVASRAETEAQIGERLQSSTPWAFSRWGDGEWSAVLGLGTANCDGQTYVPALREDLRRVLRQRPAYLLGLQPLAVRRFGAPIAAWLDREALGLAWVHADVLHDRSKDGTLMAFLEPLRRRTVVLVGPASLRALASRLPYAAFVEVPETHAYAARHDLRARIAAAVEASGPAPVVALSAGMTTNLLIHDFVAAAPARATWIDCGSVWQPYVGQVTRSYHAAIVAREAGCASS